MSNTYTFDKNVNLLLKSEVLPIGTVVTSYTWKINNVNQNSNTSNLTINTTTNLIEGKNTVSLVVVCEHGTVSNEYIAEIYVGTPIPVTTYKCSGSPNYECLPVTDGSGYATIELCQLGCKAPTGNKYKCSGYPDYTCVLSTDGTGFDTIEECNIACKSVVPNLVPILTSMTPTTAKVGEDVTITLNGSNFNPTAYPNFYSNGVFMDHGLFISGTSTKIVVHRIFKDLETMTVKVNNRNQKLSTTALPIVITPNDIPVTPTLKIVATPTTVVTGTPTDVTLNVTRTDTNVAVDGVTITLTGASTGTGTTNTLGIATINVNPSNIGTITIAAEKLGFNRGTSTITVTSIPSTQNPVKIQVDKTIVITVTDTVTNLPVQNVSVKSNNETKVTDAQGKVIFN